MKLKRLLPSCFCLSGSVLFSLNNHVNARMEGITATKSDISSIVHEKLDLLMQKILVDYCKRRKKGEGNLQEYATKLSKNAYEFCSKKHLSDFSKISDNICENVEKLNYLDCLTVSTYFSKLLNDKGIQNTVVYFPLYRNANGKEQGTYSFHSLVLYAYKGDDKKPCYKFADPYNSIIFGMALRTCNIDKLIMNPSNILSSKNVGAYDNWALSDEKRSPMPVPLMNWMNEAANKIEIDISSYNKIANKNLDCSNKFKTLIKIDNKWMIEKGEEEIEEDRLFAQEVKISQESLMSLLFSLKK